MPEGLSDGVWVVSVCSYSAARFSGCERVPENTYGENKCTQLV